MGRRSAICMRCRRPRPCGCPRTGDVAIEFTDEIDELARLLEARWRLAEIAPELARWYSLAPPRRPTPRPEVPAEHQEEVRELLALLLE